MKILELINDAEEKCKKQTKKEFPDAFHTFEDLNKIFFQIFEHVTPQSYNSRWGSNLVVTLIISTRSHRLLQTSLDAITKGYYESGMILMRSIYENNMLLSYLKDKREESGKWLVGKKSFTQQFLREQAGSTNRIYKFLSSNFAHPNEMRSSFSSISLAEKPAIELNLLPKFRYDHAEAIYSCLAMGSNALNLLVYVFLHENALSDDITKKYEKFVSDSRIVTDSQSSRNKKEIDSTR